jgi:hypothetical protein
VQLSLPCFYYPFILWIKTNKSDERLETNITNITDTVGLNKIDGLNKIYKDGRQTTFFGSEHLSRTSVRNFLLFTRFLQVRLCFTAPSLYGTR